MTDYPSGYQIDLIKVKLKQTPAGDGWRVNNASACDD
jgi:hypothetical protein